MNKTLENALIAAAGPIIGGVSFAVIGYYGASQDIKQGRLNLVDESALNGFESAAEMARVEYMCSSMHDPKLAQDYDSRYKRAKEIERETKERLTKNYKMKIKLRKAGDLGTWGLVFGLIPSLIGLARPFAKQNAAGQS
jgi:hypothetical protein